MIRYTTKAKLKKCKNFPGMKLMQIFKTARRTALLPFWCPPDLKNQLRILLFSKHTPQIMFSLEPCTKFMSSTLALPQQKAESRKFWVNSAPNGKQKRFTNRKWTHGDNVAAVPLK